MLWHFLLALECHQTKWGEGVEGGGRGGGEKGEGHVVNNLIQVQ
jgi:hypothetical protein